MRFSGSKNTSSHSSFRTLCFMKFLSAFPLSHSNSICSRKTLILNCIIWYIQLSRGPTKKFTPHQMVRGRPSIQLSCRGVRSQASNTSLDTDFPYSLLTPINKLGKSYVKTEGVNHPKIFPPLAMVFQLL